MKIALCHLEISRGPEHKNIELLENAVRIAADNGAKWVVTPETAVYLLLHQGLICKNNTPALPSQL